MPRIIQIQFQGDRMDGAAIVGSIFDSLPRPGEDAAWRDQYHADEYCRLWKRGEHGCPPPRPPEDDEPGVATIVTPTGREVSYAVEFRLWTVDFIGGSVHTAGQLLDAILAAGKYPTHVAWHRPTGHLGRANFSRPLDGQFRSTL